MNVAKIDLMKKNVDRMNAKIEKEISEQKNAFLERFDTNFDAKFEKDERFDEIDEKIRFDVKDDEIIE